MHQKLIHTNVTWLNNKLFPVSNIQSLAILALLILNFTLTKTHPRSCTNKQRDLCDLFVLPFTKLTF